MISWLLEGDPAIRWQTLRDIEKKASEADRERAKVAAEGWGADLLSRQDPEGTWGGGLYIPKWISTHYTLLMLRDFGLSPTNEQARIGCRLLLDGGVRKDGGLNYGRWADMTGKGECCVSGMGLSILSYFGLEDTRIERLAGYIFGEQMRDGGWNCRKPRGAVHSSVHTTISVLEGLRLYELRGGRQGERAKKAQAEGREFLLVHRLFRSDHTGNVINPVFTKLSFPPRWHYDVLRALDHFRDVDAPRDPRLEEAVELVRSKQNLDGRWLLENTYRARTFFDLERVGKVSRWNTLRALRVLDWWDG